MTAAQKAHIAQVAAEISHLYEQHGTLDPAHVVDWARENPESALHLRFEWDDSKAAANYRLAQARAIITEITVEYPDRKVRQVYVSLVEMRGKGGYLSMVDVLSDTARRASLLAQAFAEYERVNEKYKDLKELADVRAAVVRARKPRRARAA